MTDQQINAAIADVCGWVPDCDRGICWDQNGNAIITCPKYCADLNAMHEAEKVLAPKNWNRFSEKWWNYYHHCLDLNGDAHKTIHATARQRAEAFLRTLGKWEEGK